VRNAVAALVLVAAVAACTSGGEAAAADLPSPVTEAEFDEILATSTTPIVVNVWASWCVPCRSEAPLLSTASATLEGSVRFVMLDVQDSPDAAARFIAEFYAGAVMEHVADGAGNIPIHLGATRGVPITFFYAAGGELVKTHFGAIDERTIALQIDELLTR
jgi:cytochrome c biogenesis protein CcmG/thiol:disulfide interchange protein DsbE